ncbi:MAG: Ig domain-containing protein, partial [Candidatus Aenigmarchaeota archaeon]
TANNYTTEDLYCWAEGEDAESASLTANWQWWLNGTLNETGSTSVSNDTLKLISVLGSGNTSVDDEWNCSVMMEDDIQNETDWNNASLTIRPLANTVPATSQLIFNSTNGNNYTNEDISCYAEGTDAEQSSLTAYWLMFNGSTLLYTGSKAVSNGTLTHLVTVYSGNYTKGDSWKCSVLIGDGSLNESSWNNATLVIANAPPTITTPLGTTSRTAGTEFYHDYNATDPDMDDGIDTLTWSDNTALFNIDSSTGEINDTPAEPEVGIYSVTVTVSDATAQANDGFTYVVVSAAAPAAVSNMTVTLTLNNTSNMVYVPGVGARPASQFSTIWSNPPRYYLASYSDNILYGLVFAYQNPGFLMFSRDSSSHSMSINMDKKNALTFLTFTKGDWRNIEEKMGLIESYEFLNRVSPSFGYGLGLFQNLKALLDYNSTLVMDKDAILNPGSHSMIVEYVRDEGGRPVIAIRRT